MALVLYEPPTDAFRVAARSYRFPLSASEGAALAEEVPFQPLPAGSAEGGEDDGRIAVTLEQEWDAKELSTGRMVWKCSVATADLLVREPELVRGKKIVEVGSGCGLLGLVAALAGAEHVTLTDVDEVLPLLRRNVCERADNVSVQRCFWGDRADAEALALAPRLDLVIGSDVSWNPPLFQPLVDTLVALQARHVLLAFADRYAARTQAFTELLLSRFELQWRREERGFHVLYLSPRPDSEGPLLRASATQGGGPLP